MAALRRTLRSVAATWLVFQFSWLAALVPRDCCAAHRPAETGCHELASATQCPMRAADGTPCPMHRGDGHHSAHQTASTDHDCRLIGVCDGPLSAFFALLSNHGILQEPPSVVPGWEAQRVMVAADVNAIGRFETPDAPPPRA